MQSKRRRKTCSKCKKSKTLDSFYKKKNGAFGCGAYCKDCRRKLNAEQRIKKKERVLYVAEGFQRCNNAFCPNPVQPKSAFVSMHLRRRTFTARCRHCRTIDYTSRLNPNTTTGRCKNVWTEWQKSNCCKDCGESDYRVIQADHEYDKVKCCSNYNYWPTHGGTAALKLELLKCTPRCAFCHFLKTKERRGSVRRRKSVQEKMDILNAIKINIGCQRCQRPCTNDTTQAFHFDHNDAAKKTVNPSKTVNMSWRKFHEKLPEIKACTVLCANCHHIKTHYEL